MSEPLKPPPGLIFHKGIVRACHKCGQQLQGPLASHRCPERSFGEPIAEKSNVTDKYRCSQCGEEVVGWKNVLAHNKATGHYMHEVYISDLPGAKPITSSQPADAPIELGPVGEFIRKLEEEIRAKSREGCNSDYLNGMLYVKNLVKFKFPGW